MCIFNVRNKDVVVVVVHFPKTVTNHAEKYEGLIQSEI